MMPIPLGSQGQADFSQPIDLLMDCHRRIEHFLEVLRRIIARYGSTALDDEGRLALETALNYFRQAAPRHTADEEESLFPRMRSSDHPQVRQAMAELDRLEADHRVAEVAHDRIDQIGCGWLEAGRLDDSQRREIERLVTELIATYAEHIKLEDEKVFALASQTLDADALEQVGGEMKRRRVDAPGRPGSRCAARRKELFNANPDDGGA